MTTKYFCDYCGEEFDNSEDCRVHEEKCANSFKNEILIYTKALGWIDGQTFIENSIALDDILIIKNTGYKALYIIDDLHSKNEAYSPLEETTKNPQDGFYYWSAYFSSWVYAGKWDNTLSHIVNTGSDLEDD